MSQIHFVAADLNPLIDFDEIWRSKTRNQNTIMTVQLYMVRNVTDLNLVQEILFSKLKLEVVFEDWGGERAVFVGWGESICLINERRHWCPQPSQCAICTVVVQMASVSWSQ